MSEKVRGRKNYGSKSIHGTSETSPLKTQPSAERDQFGSDILSARKLPIYGESGAYELRTSLWSATGKDTPTPVTIHQKEQEKVIDQTPIDSGQSYETNPLGLIDRIRTEHLYNKRLKEGGLSPLPPVEEQDDTGTDNPLSGLERKRILNTSELFRRKPSQRMQNEAYDRTGSFQGARGS